MVESVTTGKPERPTTELIKGVARLRLVPRTTLIRSPGLPVRGTASPVGAPPLQRGPQKVSTSCVETV
jgi:hypothetical protein